MRGEFFTLDGGFCPFRVIYSLLGFIRFQKNMQKCPLLYSRRSVRKVSRVRSRIRFETLRMRAPLYPWTLLVYDASNYKGDIPAAGWRSTQAIIATVNAETGF